MKIQKKSVAVLVGASLLVSVWGSVASAATNCNVGEILEVGVNPLSPVAKYEIWLTCEGLFVDRKFFIPEETLGDSGYATALTAKSIGKQVFARLASSRENSLVEQIRILDTDVTP